MWIQFAKELRNTLLVETARHRAQVGGGLGQAVKSDESLYTSKGLSGIPVKKKVNFSTNVPTYLDFKTAFWGVWRNLGNFITCYWGQAFLWHLDACNLHHEEKQANDLLWPRLYDAKEEGGGGHIYWCKWTLFGFSLSSTEDRRGEQGPTWEPLKSFRNRT